MAVERVVVEGVARLPSFSHATLAGDFVYVAGKLGTRPGSLALVPGGTGPETTQVAVEMTAVAYRPRRA